MKYEPDQLDLFNDIHLWEEHWKGMPKFFPPTRDTEKRNLVDVSDVQRIARQKTKMLPLHPIYIISKGRHENPKTANALNKLGIDYRIVVEPKELHLYQKTIKEGKILVAPENFSEMNQGGVPVRNYVLNLSRGRGEAKHWILDDNIDGFGYQKTGRRINTASNGDLFRQCEDFVAKFTNIKIAGIRYRFHHNYSKSPYVLNTRIYSCLLIDNSIKHDWRGKYNEDTDLCLRVLKDGDCTMLFTWCYCNKAGTLSTKGGNEEIYQETDNRKEFAESLQKQHPEHVTITWLYERWHHLVNYKPFRRNKINPL